MVVVALVLLAGPPQVLECLDVEVVEVEDPIQEEDPQVVSAALDLLLSVT
jgi:hypothetical protein